MKHAQIPESVIVTRVEPILAELDAELKHCRLQAAIWSRKTAIAKAKHDAVMATMMAIRDMPAEARPKEPEADEPEGEGAEPAARPRRNGRRRHRPRGTAQEQAEFRAHVLKLFEGHNTRFQATAVVKAIRPRPTYWKEFFALQKLVKDGKLETVNNPVTRQRVFFAKKQQKPNE
jgi:hypothetical protein